MSTRITVACGDEWHLYIEALDGTLCFKRDYSDEVNVIMYEDEWNECEDQIKGIIDVL